MYLYVLPTLVLNSTVIGMQDKKVIILFLDSNLIPTIKGIVNIVCDNSQSHEVDFYSCTILQPCNFVVSIPLSSCKTNMEIRMVRCNIFTLNIQLGDTPARFECQPLRKITEIVPRTHYLRPTISDQFLFWFSLAFILNIWKYSYIKLSSITFS